MFDFPGGKSAPQYTFELKSLGVLRKNPFTGGKDLFPPGTTLAQVPGMKNRCTNTGIKRKKPYLSLERSTTIRSEIDHYIDGKITEWNQTIPFATHFQSGEIHRQYYNRFLIETALRIRLLRVSEANTQAEVAKISPEAAQIWAHYEYEEMIHDKLFIDDLERSQINSDVIFNTEPYLSTKLLTGFFSYLLNHEGPLGVLVYSYLVEYVNVKLDGDKINGLKNSVGEKNIKGQISHTNTDVTDDHPGEVWAAMRHLIQDEDDIKNIKRYIDEHQKILGMFFQEIYSEMVGIPGKTSEMAKAG